MSNKGKLFVVATPIGNLQDFTFRAVETLKSVHCIFAEDTRTSKKLINHYDIDTKLYSYHDHSSCLLYTSPSPRDVEESRMPSSA